MLPWEAFPSCDSGNVELLEIVGGTCGSGSTFPGADAGLCINPGPCGAEGQRACDIFEQAAQNRNSCNSGLIELGGCTATECGLSSGWCYNPTPCGGEGQRACCNVPLPLVERLTPCNDGLTQVFGIAGDATCGVSSATDVPPLAALSFLPAGAPSVGTCMDLTKVTTPISEPSTGWHAPASSNSCDMRGYADLHVHMFAHLAHGGGVLAGLPYDPVGGINEALHPDFGTDLDLVSKSDGELAAPLLCDANLYPDCGTKVFHAAHILFDDAVGVGTHEGPPACFGIGCGAASNFGSPLFNGWPTWRSTTHQQVYYKWLERAWRGGLRLMGQLAVTNEALCRGSKHLRNTDCSDEMAPVDAQIQATKDFQDYVDSLSGGAGMGWFRIVTTPQQAREVISDGKLAVVLGIEVANLFNCKKSGCTGKDPDPDNDPQTTAVETDEVYVKRMVDKYYDKGVRIIFPVHNFDNAFGSPATWQNAINVGNFVSEGAFWDAEDCPGEAYGFKTNDFISVLINLLGFGNFAGFLPHSGDASCNAHGLTPLGVTLTNYLMQKGIMIDVDHMSNKAFDQTLSLAEGFTNSENVSEPRPVIASHVQFFDLNQEQIRHERMRTKAQLDRIRNGGGMIAAMLKDDVQDTDNTGQKLNVAYTNSPTGKIINDNCRHSSKTWAQMYQYAVDTMHGPVAMGSDFNGVAGHVGPRFGFDACGQDRNERSAQGRSNTKLQYPFSLPGFGSFDKQVTGMRTFDFNVDGLAHIGLLPDMVADLKKIGMTDTDLDPLFHSASGFVDTWDRAQGTAGTTNQLSQLACESKIVNADNNCQAPTVSIASADTATTYAANLVQTPAAPYGLGVTSVTLSTNLSDTCGLTPGDCAGTVTVVDQTAPPMTCPQVDTAECTGPNTAVQFTPPVPGADNCGPSFFLGCTAASGNEFLRGVTQVTCFATDQSANLNTCNMDIEVEDTKPPEISCPSDVTKECTGGSSAQATPGIATGSDVCSSVSISTYDPASFPLGNTPLKYTAVDEAGLKADCTSNIKVQDTQVPSISCPAGVIAECTGNRSAPVAPAAATGPDVCASVQITNPPAGVFPVGLTPLSYLVTDGVGLTAGCTSSVTVRDTTPPQISCPAAIVAECTGNRSAQVTPAAATGSDICGSVALTRPAAGTFPMGLTPLTYQATDQAVCRQACGSSITVKDTTAPTISGITATPNVFWSPNHKMELVNVQVAVTDICDSTAAVAPVCQITNISSNEPQNGLGDGDVAPDWQQTGPLKVKLRAERGGSGSGRIYTLQLTCTDRSGNTKIGTTTVSVPNNQK